MAEAVAETRVARWKWGLPDRLPPLSGWALVAYRILWCAAALLALASVALAYRAEVALQRQGRAFFDLGLSNVGPDGLGRTVQPFSPQAKRQFSEREELLTVDGRAVPLAEREGQARALEGPDGVSAIVTLRRADGSRHQLQLTRSSSYLTEAYAGTGITWASRRWIVFGVGELASLLLLITGLLLFLRRPGDPVAALIAMSSVVSGIRLAALFPSVSPLAIALSHLLGNVLFFTAVLAFPDGRFRPHWARIVATACVAASLVWVWVEQAAGAISTLSPLILLMWLGVTVAVIAAIVARYRTTRAGVAKQQIKLAIFGFVAGFLFLVISLCCSFALGAVGSEGTRIWLTLIGRLAVPIASLFIAAGLLVSLLRYRLYDAEATISRSVAYGALTVALLAIFAGSERVIELLGEEYFGESLGALAGGIGAAFAAVMIVPLHHRASHWAEKRFRKQLIRLRHGLPLLLGDLRETAGLERIAAAALDAVTAGVRASRAALLVGDALVEAREITPDAVAAWRAGWTPAAHDGLDCARSDPLFPMRVPLEADGHGRVGWLLLGPRPDGSFYGKDEREALAEIADPLARALEIVRTREQREEERKAETSLLRRAIDALARRMTAMEERSSPRVSKSRA